MSDHCEVLFTAAAAKEMKAVTKKDSRRAVILHDLIAQVEEDGWILSLHSEAIKILREQTCVGEIRDVGSGGYRLFMFWHDTDEVRELWVCRVVPKRDVESKRRLSDTRFSDLLCISVLEMGSHGGHGGHGEKRRSILRALRVRQQYQSGCTIDCGNCYEICDAVEKLRRRFLDQEDD